MSTANHENLRIVSLRAENYKRLRAVHITPSGDVIQITGANDNGKTSVLDSIWAALKNVMVDAPMPIRKGTEKATIRLELGRDGGPVELVVERRFTQKNSVLVVESPDGAQFKSPQSMLDALVGALSFDPLEFARMRPDAQYEALRRTVNLEVDLDKLDDLNRGDYQRRTDVNRDAKAKRALAEAAADPGPAPDPVDEKRILDLIEESAAHNASVERLLAGREAVAKRARQKRDDAAGRVKSAADLRRQADEAERDAALYVGEAESMEKQLQDGASSLPQPVNLAEARAALEQAQAQNRMVAAHWQLTERRRTAYAEVEALEMQSAKLTESIDARESAKASAIKAAKMPVEELGFGDKLVTYRGVPFSQASSAVKTRVSLAIAMAANPKIRVVRIQDGSLLDEQSMGIVAQMAHERGYQVWVEKVDTSGKIGVYIEDGTVKAVDGQAQAVPQ